MNMKLKNFHFKDNQMQLVQNRISELENKFYILVLPNPDSIQVSTIVSIMAIITKERSPESCYSHFEELYLRKKMFLCVGNPNVIKSDEMSFQQLTLKLFRKKILQCLQLFHIFEIVFKYKNKNNNQIK